LDTQRILHEVEAEITKLERIASVLRSVASNGDVQHGKPKGMSAAGRKRISIAQKLRWAKSQGKPKRTMSASARRKIAAAQRARWAKVKVAQKKAA
jgi:hypothetical protein